jgi:hypothetical protein
MGKEILAENMPFSARFDEICDKIRYIYAPHINPLLVASWLAPILLSRAGFIPL